MGVLSGGVAGVLVDTVFDGAAPAWFVATAVALMTGAGPLANIGSLGWAHWSLGRSKVSALNRLQTTPPRQRQRADRTSPARPPVESPQ